MWHIWEKGAMCTGFWSESPKERDHLKDQGIDGIKLDLREIGWRGVERIHLPKDREHWQAVKNAVMNLPVLVPGSQLVITSSYPAMYCR
jgi:hypothetical protein